MSLSSTAGSDVLLALVLGHNSPLRIASYLLRAESSVVEQLNRLREQGYVERAQKLGKIQLYEIDWNGLIRGAIRVSPLLGAGQAGGSERELTNNLQRNDQLSTFVRRVIERVAQREDAKPRSSGLYRRMWPTFRDVMMEFEGGLLLTFPKAQGEDFERRGLPELFEGLSCWYNACQEVATVFDQELRKTLSTDP